MNLDELHAHPFYELCRASEQTFLDVYLRTNGNLALAIRTAYPKVTALGSKALQLQADSFVGALIAIIDDEEIPTDEGMAKIIYKAMKTGDNSLTSLTNAAELIKKLSPNEKPLTADDLAKARRKAAEELDKGVR